MPANEDRQCLRVRIIKVIDNNEEEYAKKSSKLKFVCSMKNDEIVQVSRYNEILDFIEQQEDNTIE